MLSDDEFTKLRLKLEAQRAELLERIADGQSASATVELDQARQGRLSRMDAMQQQAMAQASSASGRARLAAIEAALRRLQANDYGDCRECGEPVGIARLTARPEARLCITCEAAAEQD